MLDLCSLNWIFFLAFAPDGWGNPFRKQVNLRLYLLFKYSIVDETVFPKGIIIGLIVAISVKKSLKKINLSEIYEWFKDNIKKYAPTISEVTGIDYLYKKIKNLN